jgi:hypothetical protein
MLLLPLLIAAAPVDVHLRSAALLGPTTEQPVGWAESLPVSVSAWKGPTLLRVRHDGRAVSFEAFVDLTRDGTQVEARVRHPVRVSGVGDWVLVLKGGATVPLLGRAPEGLRVGFLPEQLIPFAAVTLPEVALPVPPTKNAPLKCAVAALSVRADDAAPSLTVEPSAWTAHRSGPDTKGFTPVHLENTTATLHGFVRPSALRCDEVGAGGLGLSGLGTGAGDGTIEAEAAVLPAGTRLFAAPVDSAFFARLKKPTAAFTVDGRAWRLDPLSSGSATVQLTRVFLAPDVHPPRERRRPHGIGSSTSRHPNWPRLEDPPSGGSSFDDTCESCPP